MLTILSSTNRKASFTYGVASTYASLALQMGIDHVLFDLADLPEVPFGDFIYRKGDNPLRDFAHQVFNSSDQLLIVMPEYNGSFPGILKMVIDCANPEIFAGKKIGMTGVASGRAGNLRGMDHLTGVMQYLKADVFWNKLPISLIRNCVDENRLVNHPDTLLAMQRQLVGFETFCQNR